MRSVIRLIVTLFSFSCVYAQVSLEVIYPREDQQLPAVDSTFIFGNVTPNSSLLVNGIEVPVHRDGGWLAFVPVEPGKFSFDMVAVHENDTSRAELPVYVGAAQSGEFYTVPLIPISPYPYSEVDYSVGDLFEFSFKGPAGFRGWFEIGNSGITDIKGESKAEDINRGSVFGEISRAESGSGYVTYNGYYRFRASDAGRWGIRYGYTIPGQEGPLSEVRRFTESAIDDIVTVWPEFPPLIGILRGRAQIIRTGPRMGYKLLYQPRGIKVHITGEERDFYKIDLADGITGYTNVDSVNVLRSGAPLPKGRVTFISVDKTDDGIMIAAGIGEKLPFEVRESLSGPGLEIDLYGVTGDVDWIRYNQQDDLTELVSWSQPQDDVFRITVELSGEGIGGYQPYYEGTEFNLRISRKPAADPFFGSPVKGMKIAIDPGHSHDSGAIGPTGLKEKDANLWIAHELRQMLLHRGAEVMMTRYGHEHVPLYDRPDKAEKWGADLLISIHNNALPDGINPFENNGTSVYYYHPHSKPLAESIHKHLLKQTGLSDHGLYYGNLVLTRPTSMPAVLVECAFMMIPEQEALLKTDKFQRKCAKAILNGIEDYLRQ
jgi:N-acetylmuramoyl-L-alanine amidase